MMNVAESQHQRNETKNFPCEVCRQWFTRRRLTARFCSPRCRQRAHRRATRLPLHEIRSANGHSQRNVAKSGRGPSDSAEGVSKPPPPFNHVAAAQPDSFAVSSTPHLVQDQQFPNMWRIAFPDGRLSIMVNITRAKDALALAKRRSRRADR
jgi:hypothetical protein